MVRQMKDQFCILCDGSGEGYSPDTICTACKGFGVVHSEEDDLEC